MKALRPVLIACLLAAMATIARAHEIRPAYLEIHELADQRFDVLWKQPILGDVAVHLLPRLSNHWLDRPPSSVAAEAGFRVLRWRGRADRPDSLRGSTVSVEGVEATITDVLISVRLADGRQIHDVLRADHPSFSIPPSREQSRSIPAYLRLGVEHILTGFDHLLFVLGLMLLVQSRRQLFGTITAFTLAHSITLAAATLGWVRAPAAVIEALVALSIVFLAVELVRSYRSSTAYHTLAIRYPWLIAFAFGLLHGFAFAGSLSELGIPHPDIPLALFLFNVGVETGQLLFVGAVSVLLALVGRVRASLPLWTRYVMPYAIGSVASFWFLERLAAITVHSP